MVSMTQAFKNYWKNYFNFRADATRAEYWWMVLWGHLFAAFWVVIGLGVLILNAKALEKPITSLDYALHNLPLIVLVWFGLTLFFSVIVIIPSLSLVVRRLHDTGLSNFWVWFLFLVDLALITAFEFYPDNSTISGATTISAIIIFIFMLLPSNLFEYTRLIGRDR